MGTLDWKVQEKRLQRRIAYAEAVIHSHGTTAPLKAKVLPMLYRALQKIRLGTYEACDDCGNAIGEERLRAIPGAIRCAACQHEHEGECPSLTLSS